MRYVLGIDEAGRGPLAGPVAVGVAAVSSRFDMKKLKGVRDSKKLSAQQREEWYRKLKNMSGLSYRVSMVGAGTIDKIGIVPSLRRAMRLALTLHGLNPKQCKVLLDGSLYAPEEYIDQKTIVHGDDTEPLISAASIMAKVTRDRHMARLAKKYPLYGFDQHKGYGTKAHIQAIVTHGLTDIHRASFCGSVPQKRLKCSGNPPQKSLPKSK